MESLNLPSFDCKITESEGKKRIFDPIRKKYIVLTPEEWVRQHIIHLLVEVLGYPKSLIRIESGLSYHSVEKRSDIVVFDKKAEPYLLIECKATNVKLDKKVLSQASMYNKTLKAPFLAVSNGLRTFCFQMDFDNGASVQLKDFPSAP